MTKYKSKKEVDKAIEQAYYRNCSGVQVLMTDIPKIFEEGHKAISEGRDLDAAIVAFVNSIRKN